MHSFSKCWIHAIWSTKGRKPFIVDKITPVLYPFIVRQFAELQSPALIVNGTADHLHCLFNLSPEKPLDEVMKQVKRSSSRFMNSAQLCPVKFAWQAGYAAFSVSDPGSNAVAAYIKNQKHVHLDRTFSDEYNDFLRLHGFTPIDFATEE